MLGIGNLPAPRPTARAYMLSHKPTTFLSFRALRYEGVGYCGRRGTAIPALPSELRPRAPKTKKACCPGRMAEAAEAMQISTLSCYKTRRSSHSFNNPNSSKHDHNNSDSKYKQMVAKRLLILITIIINNSHKRLRPRRNLHC